MKLAGGYTLAFREKSREEGRKEKVEKKLAAPICVCKSTVFSRLSQQICLGYIFSKGKENEQESERAKENER